MTNKFKLSENTILGIIIACAVVVLFGMGWVIIIADHYEKTMVFKPFCQEQGYERATDVTEWDVLYTHITTTDGTTIQNTGSKATWKVECDKTEMFRVSRQQSCKEYNKWGKCEKYKYDYYEVKE